MADICKRENITFSQDALTIAYKELKGDLRACLTVLQSTYNMHGEITDAYINKQLSIIDDTIWTKLIECKGSQELLKYVNDIQMEAFSVQKLLVSLIRWAFNTLSTEQVYKLSSLVSRIERQLLYQTDNSLLLHELFFMVWSIHHT